MLQCEKDRCHFDGNEILFPPFVRFISAGREDSAEAQFELHTAIQIPARQKTRLTRTVARKRYVQWNQM